MAWSNDVTFGFIELYQSEAAIWNPIDPLHKDKTKVNEAWDRISNAMNIPVADLKKKKETLMAAFRLNHKKKLASIKSGTPEIKPVWIFYEPMAEFLADVYDYRSGSSSSVEDGGSSSFSTTTTLQEKWDPIIEIGVEELSNEEDTQPSQKSESARKRRHSETASSEGSEMTNPHDLCHTFLARAMSTLSHILVNVDQTKDDECDIYGKLVAKKLSRLPELERLELMYEIDSLFIHKLVKKEARDSSLDITFD